MHRDASKVEIHTITHKIITRIVMLHAQNMG